MLTNFETGLMKSAYENIQTPLRMLMSSCHNVKEEYHVNNNAGAETFLDVKRYADALMELSEIYSGHYKTDKSWERKDSLKTTHQMITEQALCIIKMNNFPKADDLIGESSGPDDDPETVKFVMEGHFCGRLSDGGLGNFLQKYMPPLIFDLLEKFGGLGAHLNESALSNIETYSEKFVKNRAKVKYLAWTLHFLQDITAPHHAGNIPAIIPSLIPGINGGCDTHSPFEEFANELMRRQPDKFNNDAVNLLQQLRLFPSDIREPQKLQDFGKMVLQKSFDIIKSPLSKTNIKNVGSALQNNDHGAWEEVISMSMPLAIASSAAVIEKMLL